MASSSRIHSDRFETPKLSAERTFGLVDQMDVSQVLNPRLIWAERKAR
jgi:hypothetical protein